MKILDFGSLNIDYVYTVSHIVQGGETLASQQLSIFSGGKGLNQAIALARAGAPVHFAGCIGEDGSFLKDLLAKNGVDVSNIRTASIKNGHAIIQIDDNGENAILLYPGANFQIEKPFVDEVLRNFDAGDILVLQNEISNLQYIVEQAHRKGMCIVLNPSPINEAVCSIDFNKISYLILNEIEAKSILRSDQEGEYLEQFIRKYPNLKVMLTLGKNGCVYKDKEQEVYHPIFQTKAVDTTAAGDTFTGYFIAGITGSHSMTEVLKTASCAAAISVSRPGAAPSIPVMQEVIHGMATMKTQPLNPKDKLLVEKLEDYITKNMAAASLQDFAERLGYSATHVCHLIKQRTGKNFMDNLHTYRMKTAAQLLINSQLSIGEIIKQTGYHNESYFRKLFRSTYHQNPLEYRNSGGRKLND